jgi:uncharacterized protein
VLETEQPEAIQPVPEVPKPVQKIWGGWPTVGLSAAIFAIYFIVQNLVGIVFAIYLFLQNPQGNLFDLVTKLQTNGLMISIATIASTIAGMGFIVLFIKIRKNVTVSEYLGLNPIRKTTLLVLLVVALGLLAVSFGFDQVVKDSQNSSFMIDTYKTSVWPLLLWIATVIFAPIFEESFFRGFLFVGLKQSRIGAIGAVVLTSLIFASLHIQYDWYGIAQVLVLGITFGVVRLKTGSLWSTLFLHSLWNLIGMVQTALIINGVGG